MVGCLVSMLYNYIHVFLKQLISFYNVTCSYREMDEWGRNDSKVSALNMLLTIYTIQL